MDGSGRNTTSSVLDWSAGVPPAFVCESAPAQSVFTATVFVGSDVLGMKPSCSHLRQELSKSAAVLAASDADGVGAVVGAPASRAVPGAAAPGYAFGRVAGVPLPYCVGDAFGVTVEL